MVRVLLVEDQEIVRRGLKLLLTTQPDMEIVGEAEDGQQAVDLVQELDKKQRCPEIVLMDIKMPNLNGVEATRRIMATFPDVKIIVLTTFEDNEYVSEALSHGAKGYLLKDTPLEELSDAIRSIHKGYTQFGPGIVEKAVTYQPAESAPEPPALPPGFETLTKKEKEVLSLVAQGLNNKEISAKLYMSEGTIRNHISHILGRLNVRDRTQAAIIASAHIAYLTAE